MLTMMPRSHWLKVVLDNFSATFKMLALSGCSDKFRSPSLINQLHVCKTRESCNSRKTVTYMLIKEYDKAHFVYLRDETCNKCVTIIIHRFSNV